MTAQLFMSYATTGLMLAAALLHVACIRDRTIYVTRAGTTARMLMAVGLFGLSLRFGLFIWDHGQLEIPTYVLFFHSFVALGMLVYDLHRFAPFRWMDTEPTDWDQLNSEMQIDLPSNDPRRGPDRRHDRRKSSVHTRAADHPHQERPS